MAGSTFGTLFRVTTAGESHGPGNLCIVDGCPPGLELSVDDLIPDLQRRKPGQSRITTPRKEDDTPEILSGVFEGKTTGTGEFVAWLAHKDGAAPRPIDLLMFADMMPPPIFTIYGAYGWVPTVELTVQVRRKPAAGPLLARHITRQVTRGVAETDTEIWDVNGDLAAMARQTYKVRMPEAD